MKIAIISITENGKELSNIIKDYLIKNPRFIKIDIYFKNVKNTINNIFFKYDAIIGIMATGILIRSIANQITSKDKDPAILSIDEKGQYVISLLSGHLGGANELTNIISEIINAKPIITTATDINNKLSIDSLANKYFWKIENVHDIVIFNKAILNNQSIDLLVNIKQEKYLKEFLHTKKEINLIKNNSNNSTIIAKYKSKILKIIPEKMVFGIGSKKNISMKNVLIAIKTVCTQLNIDINRIDSLATVDVKQNEEGIILASEKLKLPLFIIKTEDIKNFKSEDCTKSKFVEKTIGAYGVCEPCALMKAGLNSKLIYKKTAFNGVTIAVAISNEK